MDFTYLTHEEVPKTLYHYTSLEALLAIVHSRRLRASDIRFLNDTSEAVRMKEDVIAILERRVASQKDQEIVDHIIKTVKSSPRRSWFVASFSEKSDLLSQWRAYCPSGLGVSIGFSSDCLNEQFIANPKNGEEPFFLSAPLQKVRYYESSHQDKLQNTIERLLELERKTGVEASDYPNFSVMNAALSPWPEDVGFDESQLGALTKLAFDKIREVEGDRSTKTIYRRGDAISAWIFQLSPFIKHSAFGEECEWRKLVSKDTRPMPGQKFRTGKSTLIPFVEIMLDVKRQDAECVPANRYFIDEVVIGPTPTPELTLAALRSLFDSEGHPEVILRSSGIPFKDW